MIHIITDSTSDISQKEAKALGIHVVPLSIHFGAETYRDGIDLTKEAFYDRLAVAETLPTTSQVNPAEFEELFRSLLASPDDSILGIFISSKLSGTYQSAVIAKDILEQEAIHLIDSQNATFGLELLVMEAVKMRHQGSAVQEIAASLRESVPKVRLYATVDTLKYLKMGGRISSATALVGNVLGITPLIAITDGKVLSVGKTRGRKNGFRWIEQEIAKESIDFQRFGAYGHINDEAALAECQNYFEEKLPFQDTFVCNIGATVGTHVGPGAVGIAFFVK